MMSYGDNSENCDSINNILHIWLVNETHKNVLKLKERIKLLLQNKTMNIQMLRNPRNGNTQYSNVKISTGS